MYRTTLAVTAIVAGMTAVAAQSDAIQKRNALMKSMWKDGISAPYRMAQGKEPFDQAKAEAGLAKMAEIVAAPQFGCKSRHQIQLIDKNLGQQARLRGKAGEPDQKHC